MNLKFSKPWFFFAIFIILSSSLFAIGNLDTKIPFFGKYHLNLGLDLLGGTSVLLEVDDSAYFESKLDTIQKDIASLLYHEKIGYTKPEKVSQYVVFTLRDVEDSSKTFKLLKKNLSDFTVENSEGAFKLTISDTKRSEIKKSLVEKSLQIIRKRVDETGSKEILIYPRGQNRITLQVPGEGNNAKIASLLNTQAKLTFHFLDENEPFVRDLNTKIYGSNILEGFSYSSRSVFYAVKPEVEIDGSELKNAQAIISNSEPAVSFEFSSTAARKFADLTSKNIGRPFAIVLDNKVLSAPKIKDPILSGSGVISGSFSIEEAQNLSLLLRAGALPAAIKIIEQREIGPSLGLDSINSGKNSMIISTVILIIFMSAYYGIAGVISSITVLLNIAMVVGIMSLGGFTLTLPGIAGIILTIAMSVDAGIIIFERIIFDMKRGSDTLGKIFSSAFDASQKTIIDANLTAIISGLALYEFGFGPIRGFAMTLIIGVFVSMFTAIFFIRPMLIIYVKYRGIATHEDVSKNRIFGFFR